MALGEFDDLGDEFFFIIVVALISSILALLATLYLVFFRVLPAEKGNDTMVEIADNIKKSAKAFLRTEYSAILLYVVIMAIIIAIITTPSDEILPTIIAFLTGSILSGLTGYIGMLIAVESNVRTANAAKNGLNQALQIAFGSGGVMGLSVVSISMLGLIVIYSIWGGLKQEDTRYLAGFGFGASSIALFARVGGGIYTKAADVGADLVGKVESNIPEDDPRNPATIADNVGDNVGDVAGMGADLFESFVGSIIATIQLSEDAILFFNGTITDYDLSHFIALPFWITGFGIFASIMGIFLVRTSEQNNNRRKEDIQEILLFAIRKGIFSAAILCWILSFITCGIFFGFESEITYKLLGCISIGLFAGELIGFCTEYSTSFVYKPTRSIAKKSRIGSASVIIQGLGIGMISTFAPVIIVCISIISCFRLAGNYGIGIAAVGMLSTLGVTLSTDAFGPVSDNAGGIAEMAELDVAVRETTDGLDALGNTTAATGKGFSIGSAVLATLALLAAYKKEANLLGIDITNSDILTASIFGAMLPYIFAALTMMAVGRASSLMITEVRRQFREYKLLSDNPTQKPDYEKCVAISTKASLIEMIIPGILSVTSPLFIGYLLGTKALGGMLTGCIASAFMLAIFMANAGGAWDNAKKFIEAEQLGSGKGKGTKYHRAAVVGDTIGDPFKDTSGPSLNILIKLMTMMALLFGKSFPTEPFESHEFVYGLIFLVIFLLITISLWVWMRRTNFGKLDYDNNEENLANLANDNNDNNEEIQLESMENDNNNTKNDNDKINDLKNRIEQLLAENKDLKRKLDDVP